METCVGRPAPGFESQPRRRQALTLWSSMHSNADWHVPYLLEHPERKQEHIVTERTILPSIHPYVVFDLVATESPAYSFQFRIRLPLVPAFFTAVCFPGGYDLSTFKADARLPPVSKPMVEDGIEEGCEEHGIQGEWWKRPDCEHVE